MMYFYQLLLHPTKLETSLQVTSRRPNLVCRKPHLHVTTIVSGRSLAASYVTKMT